MECSSNINHFTGLPLEITSLIANDSKSEAELKSVGKKMAEAAKVSLESINFELSTLCPTFKAIVDSGNGDINNSTRIFMRLMTRLHDTAKFIKCDIPATDKDLQSMDRLTGERMHCDTLINSLQKSISSLPCGLSMDDLIILGDLKRRLDLLDNGRYVGIRSFLINAAAVYPDNTLYMGQRIFIIKNLLAQYREELVWFSKVNNNTLSSFDTDVYLCQIWANISSSLYNLYSGPDDESKIVLLNKEDKVSIYIRVFQELKAQEYARLNDFKTNKPWVITYADIGHEEKFHEGFCNTHNFVLFLEQYLLGRETSEGLITKEDIDTIAESFKGKFFRF